MHYGPQTLIVVYKDEMLANQIKKLIETNDDTDGSVTGTRDHSINVVTWTEKVWLQNKKAGNITSKVLFIGSIKGVDALIPVIDLKYEGHGVRYGWAGNQAVIYVNPNEIKSIESYYDFHNALMALPAPQMIKDAVKPKNLPGQPEEAPAEEPAEAEENAGILAKGRGYLQKIENRIVVGIADSIEKAAIFTEESFRNKKAIERQMLFFGVIHLYNEGLETFMNA